jgi:hypothetical protein
VRHVVARVWLTLTASFAAVLLELVPQLGASPLAAVATSDLLVLSVAVLGVVLAVIAVDARLALSPDRGVVPPVRSDDVLVLSGRVTDPMHHPLAPRAAGPA